MNILISIVAIAVIQINHLSARDIHLRGRFPVGPTFHDGQLDGPNFDQRYQETKSNNVQRLRHGDEYDEDLAITIPLNRRGSDGRLTNGEVDGRGSYENR